MLWLFNCMSDEGLEEGFEVIVFKRLVFSVVCIFFLFSGIFFLFLKDFCKGERLNIS